MANSVKWKIMILLSPLMPLLPFTVPLARSRWWERAFGHAAVWLQSESSLALAVERWRELLPFAPRFFVYVRSRADFEKFYENFANSEKLSKVSDWGLIIGDTIIGMCLCIFFVDNFGWLCCFHGVVHVHCLGLFCFDEGVFRFYINVIGYSTKI